MKMYIEVDIEEGGHAVAEALEELANAVHARVTAGDGDALERRTMDEYRSIAPDVIIDIDVR